MIGRGCGLGPGTTITGAGTIGTKIGPMIGRRGGTTMTGRGSGSQPKKATSKSKARKRFMVSRKLL
jgi:hypothetical protein